jgi:hypothetical protein
LDRRSVQVSPTPRIQPARCIHTKNVFSLVDLPPVDETYKKIKKHVDNCKVCEEAFRNFELNNVASKIQIPKPQIDSETKEIFEREVSDLFRAFDLNAKELLKKRIKNKIKHIDSMGVDFIKMLTSKQMLTTYALGAVLFVILKQFFN